VAEEAVLYAEDRGVARVTLNRPDRLNASNGDLSRGLTAAMARAAASEAVRVILLQGAGRGFCAGADQQVLNEISADATAPNSGSGGLRYDGFMTMPKPVIAAVHGACVGVGLAMACAADIRIASHSAFFLAPFATLGMCAEQGLDWLLSRIMGTGNAAEMLLSARRVPAEEAFAKGLVSHVYPDADFADAAFAYALDLASRGAPSSFAMIKGQLLRAPGQDYGTRRAEASALAVGTFDAPDFLEAMAARREKRRPAFSGISADFDPPISGHRSA
jgi:2-(1,2-epoxy-1,2-dihydrophenyl)acetyl-CoA isomerase